MFDRTFGLVVRVPRGIPQAEGRGYARWHPMDNDSSDKLEDRRDICLRRGQMFLLASAERRNYSPMLL